MYRNFGTTELVPLKAGNSQQKTPGLKKYATLSPYITQIQRRKKTKSLLRENRCKSRNKHQSSSKSFRIKQKSASSLHENGLSKNKQEESIKYILQLVNKVSANTKTQNTLNIKQHLSKDRKQRGVSNHKHHLSEKPNNASKREIPARQLSGPRNSALQNRQELKYFNSKRDKNLKKEKKQLSFRKNFYQSKSRLQIASGKNQETIDVSRHGYTGLNQSSLNKNEEIKKGTTDLLPEKKKFRRNKYQALYSSVNSNQAREEIGKGLGNDPIKSESKLELGKKESNISINKEMDKLAENQIRKFYRQMRSKQIEKSVQKSTEKYFKQDSSYRVLKSNNDIQIYISTMKNPSVNRNSNASTLNTSDQQQNKSPMPLSNRGKKKQNNYLEYQFDFKDQDLNSFSGIEQIQNPSQQESMQVLEENTSFQRQRREVERQFFNRQSPNVEWSDQDCQIDEV